MATPTDKVTTAMPPPPTDQLAAWIVRYGPALQRYFARKAGAAYAEDLVQEVFLRLQATAGRMPEGNVERYLFTVAKNVLIDRFRADLRRHASFHGGIEEAEDLPDDISPERILAAKQEYARTINAITDLAPRMRTALILHRFGKMSFSTIAKRMGIKKSSVQVLIQDAIKRVMRDLEDRP